MYPPPPAEIIRRLVGGTLELVSHGKYVVHLSFDNKSRVSISAAFRYDEKDKLLISPVHEFPLSESTIVRSLDHRVDRALCEQDGTLELHFSNDYVLIVYANDKAYEAYTILVDGKEYIV